MAFALVVLDASAAPSLLLPEEEGDAVAAIIAETIDGNGQIFVPGLFWHELGNGLLSAERRISLKESYPALAPSIG
jgi:predicted nucleic acid-binding protein